MFQTKITIIVPVYNVEAYLTRCIESILCQTYPYLQILLIDDGSTDRSGEICDRYAVQDGRIEVFHTENRGLVAARKFGLRNASGKYIGFVDSDDYIEADMFEKMAEVIEESQADFIHTGFIRENSQYIETVLGFEDGVFELKNSKDREQFLVKYVLKAKAESSISYSIWSKLYRSDLIKRCYTLLLNDQQYGEDLYSLCLCILQSQKIALSRYAGYHYVVKKESMSHLQRAKYVEKEMDLCSNVKRNICNYNEQIYSDLEDNIYSFIMNRMIRLIDQIDDRVSIQKFYFEDIKSLKGKKIAIFGAGAVGRDYYAQFCMYRDIEIVAWFDSNYEKYKYDYSEIAGADKVGNYLFEKIIIAVNDNKTAKEITEMLSAYGLSEAKIVWEKPKNVLDNELE